MKIRKFVAASALVATSFVGACASTTSNREAAEPQDHEASEQPGMPSEEEMKAMMEAAALHPEHANLAAMAGTWDVEMACEGQTSKSVATQESVIGTRALLGRMQGDMGGMPFEGVLLRGYHKEKNDHWALWADTWGSMYVITHGTRGEDGTITSKSEPFEWMGKKCWMEMTEKQIDADHVEATMTMKCEGKPDMTSTMKYTRRKAEAPAAK